MAAILGAAYIYIPLEFDLWSTEEMCERYFHELFLVETLPGSKSVPFFFKKRKPWAMGIISHKLPVVASMSY